MKAHIETIQVESKGRSDIIDITYQIEDAVRRSRIANGICVVQSLHTTASIIVNELEQGLLQDIKRKVSETFPKGVGWLHDRVDDNADAHLASTFLGPSTTFVVKDGKIMRGVWQSILLLELDGPRVRSIAVEVLGEELKPAYQP
ncbi:MAG: secondary thiamine-phosphate synthase enzyme YjbQ [Nitrososphaerales archaeon]